MTVVIKDDFLPDSVKKLNNWIMQHFQVFEAPGRAYFELPFTARIGDPGVEQQVEYRHRVIHRSLGFTGTIPECCRCMAAHLYILISKEDYLDAIVPIFIRHWFEYSMLEDFNKIPIGYLHGRLAFWRSDINNKLLRLDCYKPEGAIANKAILPDIWFARS